MARYFGHGDGTWSAKDYVFSLIQRYFWKCLYFFPLCNYLTVCRNLCCCCFYVASVVSDSVRPHRWQPTRLPRPWDSPGKNTGVGCHFLLQCMKVKSESEVAQSCPTLSNPMDCSLPGSSVHGIFQARVLEWAAIAFSIEISRYYVLVFFPPSRNKPRLWGK